MDKDYTYHWECDCHSCVNATYGSMTTEEWFTYNGEPEPVKQPAELGYDYYRY